MDANARIEENVMDCIRNAKDDEPRIAQAEQLVRIAELIAYCQGRVNDEFRFCRKMYGEVGGVVKGHEDNQRTINRFTAIGKRLKRYYNWKVSQLTKY